MSTAEKIEETRVPLSLIFPNPDQPRKNFDQGKLDELAASVRNHGVFTPILLTPRGEQYMIIAGERRWRASNLAGVEDIPARIIEADDDLVEELALLENIQRDDLNIIEEAMAYQDILRRKGWTKKKLAEKMGFKQVWRIDERLSLLELTEAYQTLVVEGKLGHSQAFEMSRLPPASQDVVFSKIKSGGLQSYNKLRAYVDALIDHEKQGGFFELESLSEEERSSVARFESFVGTVEKFIASGYDAAHFQKVVFHTFITPDRMDLIIGALQKMRKEVLVGAGVKEVIADVK